MIFISVQKGTREHNWGGTFYSNFEKIFSLVDLSEAYEGVFQWRINWSSRSFFKFNSVKASSALYCLRATFENNLTQPTLLAWLRHSGFCCPPASVALHTQRTDVLEYSCLFPTTKPSLSMFTMRLAGSIWSPVGVFISFQWSVKGKGVTTAQGHTFLGRSPIVTQVLYQLGATFNSL